MEGPQEQKKKKKKAQSRTLGNGRSLQCFIFFFDRHMNTQGFYFLWHKGSRKENSQRTERLTCCFKVFMHTHTQEQHICDWVKVVVSRKCVRNSLNVFTPCSYWPTRQIMANPSRLPFNCLKIKKYIKSTSNPLVNTQNRICNVEFMSCHRLSNQFDFWIINVATLALNRLCCACWLHFLRCWFKAV